MTWNSSKRGFVEAGHGLAVEEVARPFDKKDHYWAYDPLEVDATKSFVGIDGPGLESDRVRSPCTQVVAEVGHPKMRTFDRTNRPSDYLEYSRMGLLAEKK